nr:MAG TPA: hypothetical protein [Caudoviricetes sp.]
MIISCRFLSNPLYFLPDYAIMEQERRDSNADKTR